ncbi:MAG: hypothetical protein O7E52_29320, partial [Candidatus Poribacteria bacterium]|nr:hypothetical protein [Candidatus Poribacteria bacterium]
IWGEVPVVLKPTLTNTGPRVVLDVTDDLTVETAANPLLRIRLDQWVRGDIVKVWWDNAELPDPQVRYNTDGISDVSATVWLCYRLVAEEVALGTHTVEVILETRNPKVASDIVLTDVELVIQYSEVAACKDN